MVKNPVDLLSLQARRAAEARGRAAEDDAARFYTARGFTLLARRARTEAGEIDLVLADAQTLVFAEVKQRRTILDATEALQPRQRQRITAAAQILLARNPQWQRNDTRFDVIFVTAHRLRHLADAVRPDD
jgi:putative endonuclease